MDDGSSVVAIVPFRTNGIHHLIISHAHQLVAHLCTNALSGYFLNVLDTATIGSLVREGIAKGSANRVGREMLHMSSKVKQLMLVAGIRMNGRHAELTVGKRTGLVEDHSAHLCQYVHIAGTFDEDALARGSADAAKEGEWNTDHQCTRTADHQEGEGTVEPGGE